MCRVVRGAEARFWDLYAYEAFQDPDAHRAVRETAGYCARHVTQLEALREVFVSASMALAAAEGALGALARPRSRGPLRRSEPAARPGAWCPACADLGGVERDAARTLERLVDEGGIPAERLDGAELICFDHATLTEPGGTLRGQLAGVLERRAGELRRFIAGFDHAAPERATAEEGASAAATWSALRGDPGRLR